jgi:hypothetical protein
MVFEKYFRQAENDRWRLETDIPWADADLDLAASRPDVLESLRSAALIESYAPMFALKSLHLWWDSIEESAVASIQFYEEYKHYYALKRYLEPLGYTIPEREVVHVRQRNFGVFYEDRTRQLANYMISEHFTAHFYLRMNENVQEPVLKSLLTFLTQDELRHCSVFASLLERRLAAQPGERDKVIDELLHFQHQGVEVVGEHMPISMANDFDAILRLFRRIEKLTGVSLREFRRDALRAFTADNPDSPEAL